MEKRGQVAIYVIVAVVIVAAVVLVFVFFPSVRPPTGRSIVPNTFLAECIESEVKDKLQVLADQGGYINPEGFVLFQGKKVKYLCYNAQYYFPCKVQQPLLVSQVSRELDVLVEDRAVECVQELKEAYESQGFTVSTPQRITSDVTVEPGKIELLVNAPMTITGDSTQTFSSFSTEVPSQMYDLLLIATSIIDFEATYGDAETSLYIQYYPDLNIQKTKLGDGSTVYVVSDVTTGESFTFASRSVAWPPGYGTEKQ